MIDTIRAWYREHGTKLWGALQAGWSSAIAVLAVLAASPQTQFIMPPRCFAYLILVNAVLGVLTLKRGFANSRALSPPQ